MSVPRQPLRLALISILLFTNLSSSSASTIASVKVNDLFKQADLVAIVHILSGDSEHYPVTVYRAEVVTAFKGTTLPEKIYFGPFIGYGVGSEYLVFLTKADKGIEPANGSSSLSYGPIPSFFRIMYDGYSIMEIDYARVFDGKEISQQCDYGVKVNPEQIIVPDSLKVFPPGDADAVTNYKKWVRKDDLVSLLEQCANEARTLPRKPNPEPRQTTEDGNR